MHIPYCSSIYTSRCHSTALLGSLRVATSSSAVSALVAVISLLSSSNAFSAQWIGTNATLPPGPGQEWSVGTNWQAGTPPVGGDFVLIGQNSNVPTVSYLNTTSNTMFSVAALYGSNFIVGPSGVLNMQANEGRVEIGKFGNPTVMSVLAGGQVNGGNGGNNRSLEVWPTAVLNTAGTITHNTLDIRSGAKVNMTGGSLTLGRAFTSIIVGENTGSGGLLNQTAGSVSAPHIVINTGQYRISGGSVVGLGSAAVGNNALQFAPVTTAAGTTGGSLQVVGSAASISFNGFQNQSSGPGQARPTFSFVLDNSAAHITKVNFTNNGNSGQTLRTNAALEVGLSGGVLLSGTSQHSIIQRVDAFDTAWAQGPGPLWVDSTDTAAKAVIKISLNSVQNKGTLNGVSLLSFAAANLGYVDLLNVSQPFKLGMDITGGTLSNFTNALTAAGVSWIAGSGNYEIELTLDPATSGGSHFAWDLSTIDPAMGVQGLSAVPEPGSVMLLIVSGAIVFGIVRHRRRGSAFPSH